MAAASESNDASDTFWPGYVDAISNLAINLLFVIAVMCIVILSFVMEEVTKGKPQPEIATAAVTAATTATAAPAAPSAASAASASSAQGAGAALAADPAKREPDPGEAAMQQEIARLKEQLQAAKAEARAAEQKQEDATQKVQQAMQQAAQQAAQQAPSQKGAQQTAQQAAQQDARAAEASARALRELQAVQQENQKLKEALQTARKAQKPMASSQATEAVTSTEPGDSEVNDRVEVMQAKQQVLDTVEGRNRVSSASSGLIVNFDPRVVTLSPEESRELAQRLAGFGPVATTRWQITVISPKGFSEAARLAYYRGIAVRNAMIQAGASGEMINVSVIESGQPTANNARVTVRRQP